MDELDLDQLDAELTQLSDRLAAERSIGEIPQQVRRLLRRRLWRAAAMLAAGAGLVAWGVQLDSPLVASLGAAALVLVAPKRIAAALRVAGPAESLDRSVFEECAAEARRRFALEVVYLIAALPLLVGLVIASLSLPEITWLPWAAATVALLFPYVLFLRLRRSATEMDVAVGWARGESPAEEEEDEDELADESDEDLPSLTKPLGMGLVAFFFLFINPALMLGLVIALITGAAPLRPAIALGLLAIGSWLARRSMVARIRSLEDRACQSSDDEVES